MSSEDSGLESSLEARDDSPQSSISELSRSSRRDHSAQRAAQDVEGLQDYQLGDCLGKGAFGSVYKALNWGTGQTVAIKQVKLSDMPKADLKVIMQEIDLLKNLKHPNIVKYLGFVKSVESLYLILEYCENGSLHSICKNFGKFPENLVALYISQVLTGLVYLHEQGVIHRDIKGANILTTKDGLVKLADFGVATRAAGLHESSVVGTPYWMAPEVIELSGATTASDIWSLGCTVIELLDGRPPYYQLQPMPALFRIVNDDHPPLPEGASHAVCDFLLQCFQKDPNLRVSAKKLLKHHWMTSARRADAAPNLPEIFNETVESVQQYNKALKSQTRDPLLKDRSQAASPVPQKQLPPLKLSNKWTPASFRSPDGANDNWDDDFAPGLDSRSLLQPLIKPQDNFGGLLSFERLKAFSNAQRGTWDSDFDGESTLKSPLQPTQSDPLSSRPFMSPRHSQERLREPRSPPTKPFKLIPLQPLAEQAPAPYSLSHSLSQTFQEPLEEDYSDLIAVNDANFAQKLQGLQSKSADPDLFEISEFTNSQRHSRPLAFANGAHLQHKAVNEGRPAPHRTPSSIEIERFAEKDDEDFSDVLLGRNKPSSDEDSESEVDGELLLNNKLSQSWLGDDDDDDDPFAELEEGFAGIDLAANIARDRHARMINEVQDLVSSLKNTQSDETLTDLSDQLLNVLMDFPEVKRTIMSAHGMLPILEILESCESHDVIRRLLRIVNAIIQDEREIQENLCFVGGILIVTKFSSKRYPNDIRLEAAAFVQQMYQTSTLTLQMFIGCGGLNVLVEFLEEDYETDDLALIAVNGVWSVFELQGPTPKNDFCRIFSRKCVLYPLSLVLNRLLEERTESNEIFESRIANIFFIFSQAENRVKEMIADRLVLKRVLKDLKLMSPGPQITMLKFIKNLSMLSTTLDALQNSNAIEVLSDLLSSSMKEQHFSELSNQIVNTMFNLCRLSKIRQQEAALNGIIPLLMRIAKTDRPLKEFALPMLCDMAHSGKIGRKLLWQNKGLHFYVSLLTDPNWQVTALDAIFIWLQEETAKVEEQLLASSFEDAIIKCFTTSKANAFENLLDPLQKLITISSSIARKLARPDFFARIHQKLKHNKAVVRLNLLRIIRSICDASDEQTGLVKKHGLQPSIQKLAETDQAVLVRNMASDLVKSSMSMGIGRDSRLTRRRSFLRRSSTQSPMLAPSSSTSSPAIRPRMNPGRTSFVSSPVDTQIRTPTERHGHDYVSSTRNSRAHRPSASSVSSISNGAGSGVHSAHIPHSVSASASLNGHIPPPNGIPSSLSTTSTLASSSRMKARAHSESPRKTRIAQNTESTAPATGQGTPSPLKQRIKLHRTSPVIERLYEGRPSLITSNSGTSSSTSTMRRRDTNDEGKAGSSSSSASTPTSTISSRAVERGSPTYKTTAASRARRQATADAKHGQT